MKGKWRLLPLVLFLLSIYGCSREQFELSETQERISETEYGKDFFAMDTYISLTASGEQAEKAMAQVQERTEYLESLWSVTEEGSEIYALNHSGGTPVKVSDETAEILSFTLDMAKRTGGCLDPTIYPVLTAWGFTTEENRIPAEKEVNILLERVGYDRVQITGNEVRMEPGMMLDLGAVGKGYASDEAVQILREAGAKSALIDFGGNILTIGKKADGSLWRLGVKDPYSDGNAGILEVADCAVVTSGNYERYFTGEDGRKYGHILNPQTGYPVENDLASVTVIAEDGKTGDALSTPLFVMGKEGAEAFWREYGGFEMILITAEQEIFVTEGIAGQFEVSENYQDVQVIKSNE